MSSNSKITQSKGEPEAVSLPPRTRPCKKSTTMDDQPPRPTSSQSATGLAAPAEDAHGEARCKSTSPRTNKSGCGRPQCQPCHQHQQDHRILNFCLDLMAFTNLYQSLNLLWSTYGCLLRYKISEPIQNPSFVLFLLSWRSWNSFFPLLSVFPLLAG